MMRTFLLILSFILIAVGFGPLVFAQSGDTPIEAENVYAFATPDTAKTGAVFMIIKNSSGADDTLRSALTDAADIVELHENAVDNASGRMTMRKIDGITIPANNAAFLEPKGKHIMLLGLKEPLKEGANFSLTLNFATAGVITVPVKIVPPGDAMDAPDQHDDHSGHH